MSFEQIPMAALFGLIVVLTIISAYFSGTETAMMALNRYRLRHLVKQKHRGARKANRLLRRPDRQLGVILIGNNLVNALAATVAAVIGLKLFGNVGLAVAPFVFTIFFLIFAEVAPKTSRICLRNRGQTTRLLDDTVTLICYQLTRGGRRNEFRRGAARRSASGTFPRSP